MVYLVWCTYLKKGSGSGSVGGWSADDAVVGAVCWRCWRFDIIVCWGGWSFNAVCWRCWSFAIPVCWRCWWFAIAVCWRCWWFAIAVCWRCWWFVNDHRSNSVLSDPVPDRQDPTLFLFILQDLEEKPIKIKLYMRGTKYFVLSWQCNAK